MNDTVLLIIFSILMVPGIVGSILPMLPGIPYMMIIALIYGFVNHFQRLTTNELLILGLITVVSILVDYFSGLLGARFGGASKKSVLYGALGSIIGIFALPPLGMFIGAFLGILIAELTAHKDKNRAVKAAAGSIVGSLVGIIINTLISITFLILFIVFALR